MTRWLSRNRWLFVYATRMVTASIATMAAVYALGLTVELAAVISAVVVTQSNIGGSFMVAFQQVVGALLGATVAAGIALLIVPDDPVASTAALAVALAPLSVMAARSRGFLIAPITAAVVILGAPGLEVSPHVLATDRMLGVALGCGIGLLTSILVLPARASRSVVETAGRIAGLLGAQLRAIAPGDGTGEADLGSRAGEIRGNLTRLATFVDEAARERRASLAGIPDGERLLRILRRVRHDVDMLRRAARGAGDDALHERAAVSWKRAAESGASTLSDIERLLAGQHVPEEFNTLAPTVRDYRMALDEMRRAGLTHSLSTPALGRLFGVGFALEQLRRDLDDLIDVSREAAHQRKRFATIG